MRTTSENKPNKPLIGVRSIGVWAQQRTRVKNRTDERLSAFEAMVTRDWERFYRYAYRLCGGNADDAEDLLSESLMDAFRAFDSYRGEGFDRWFFRMITTNRVDMARRAKVRRAESLDAAWTEGESENKAVRDLADSTGNPEVRLIDPLYSEPMQKALDALSEEFRAVVLLSDVEQMDYQEIAETLALPIGTVRSRIHRGRHQMRKMLEKSGWNR
jgi:RNA polymerase sigma-70 factor, ECF subfamily